MKTEQNSSICFPLNKEVWNHTGLEGLLTFMLLQKTSMNVNWSFQHHNIIEIEQVYQFSTIFVLLVVYVNEQRETLFAHVTFPSHIHIYFCQQMSIG